MKIKRTWILIILFLVFCFVVIKGDLKSFDLYITKGIQNLISRKFDIILSFFSLIGTFEVTTSILLLILVLRKKLNGIKIFFIYTVSSVIEVLGKTFILHSNPPARFFRYDLDFIFPSSYVQTGYSFPSGHAMRSTFLVILIGMIIYNSKKFNKKVKLAIYICLSVFLVIMLVSRISLGEHWASDVLAGFLLGVIFGSLIKLNL